MDEQMARDFLTKDCVWAKSPEELTALIKGCRAAVLRKPVPDLEAKTRALPQAVDTILGGVEADPRFPKTVKAWKWSFREVEIDKLVCMQRYVDLPYASQISGKLDLATPEGRVKFCLTDEFRVRDSDIVELPNEHHYAVTADGYDIRVMRSGATLDQRSGDRTVSFTIGWGHPFVQVSILKGRYVLKNGYHRAFVLRKMAVDYLPCILLEASSYDDLESTGPPTYFGERTIMGAHPPLFSSFFEPEIAPPAKLITLSKVIVLRPDVTILDEEGMKGYLSNQLAEAPAAHPGGLEYIDVRPVHEDWNVYRLSDGTTLKLRAVLTRVKRLDLSEKRGGADISNIMLVCNPPRGKKGPPSLARISPEELTAAIVDRNMKFRAVSEPMNEYVTEDGKKMLLKLKLYNLAKTSKYDPAGDPIYLFNAKPELVMVDQ